MALHLREAAPVISDGSALSVVVKAGQAIDSRENSPNSEHLQAYWIARRFGLSPARARLLASLAFQEAA